MELKRLYSTGTIIALCVIIATMQAASAAPTISVEPSYQSVSSGDTFTVNITVDPDGTEIAGIDYILHFNNAVSNAISQNQGPFLGGNIIANITDNPNGSLDYGEWRTGGGVTAPGVLTTIEFEAISTGISELHFEQVLLSDPDGSRIQSATICDGRVGIGQPPTSFLINGYVFDEDENVCNNPAVTLTNLNTCKEWAAVAVESSNYYHLALESCADVIAGDILQFDVAGCSQSNTTSHTVTQAEVGFGGFECNITLGTAESDTTPPVITNVANGTPADSSVTITWDTDEASDSLVKYGTMSGVYTGDVSDMAMTASHSIGLSGLSAGTTYYFVVNSTDASDNSNESEEHSFTTLSAADTTPPVITNVANGTPTDSSATITWTTDEASDSLVKYGTTSGTYTDSETNATMVASHSITLTGLSPDTTYYFVVNSTDASGNSNESEEHSFTTAAESITSPELVSCVITPTPPVVQGTNVSVDCLFSEDVDYEIRIEDATGALIENIGSGTATNPDTKWWNTTGTPAGTYTVNVTMDNSTSGVSSYNDTNIIEVTDTSDTTPPTVIDNSPTGTSVPVTTDVTVTFNETMNQTSAEGAFSIMPGVAGAFSWSGNIMTFTPASDLADNTTYDVTISTDAKDLAGNPLEAPFIWNFTTETVVPSSTTVSIENVTVAPGESITVPIMVNYVTNLVGCEINMAYNASVVHVTDVTPGDLDLLVSTFDNGSGWMYASAINTSGLNDNVVFAYINLTAVGSKGDASLLGITVEDMFDASFTKITHTVINGTFAIGADTEPPLVTDASASRDTILNDNGRARAPGTNVTVLNVTVTDEEGDVASVTIDLSSIGGSPVQPMERITETDVWTVTTNATDGVNLTHQLTINATDNEGNYNNTVAIELTVLKRGDVCRDNVIDGNDVIYIARYLAGLEPECSSPPTEMALVGDVVGISGDPEGDGIVDLMDAAYIARYEAGLEDEP